MLDTGYWMPDKKFEFQNADASILGDGSFQVGRNVTLGKD
jgi:hypothetical protein